MYFTGSSKQYNEIGFKFGIKTKERANAFYVFFLKKLKIQWNKNTIHWCKHISVAFILELILFSITRQILHPYFLSNLYTCLTHVTPFCDRFCDSRGTSHCMTHVPVASNALSSLSSDPSSIRTGFPPARATAKFNLLNWKKYMTAFGTNWDLGNLW